MIVMTNPFEGLQDFFDTAPDYSNQAAMLALNEVSTNSGLALLRDEMNAEVNFPANYVKDNTEVTGRATANNLTTVITGRGRATSLAEFAEGGYIGTFAFGRVSVKVKNGDSDAVFSRAKLIRLKNDNIGFAIYLPKGTPLNKSIGAVRLNSAAAQRSKYDIYLLYGPSVDQVMGGAFDKRADDFTELLGDEFIRQFGRLSNNG